MIGIDLTLDKLRGVLSAELEQPRINGLVEITGHKLRRAAIAQYMNDIDEELNPLREAIRRLPFLPVEGEIQWAQAICALPVCFLEVDTTGLTDEDEMVRVTVSNQRGEVECDLLIKPSRRLSSDASAVNGLTDTDLHHAEDIVSVWERIRSALLGRYVLGFWQGFDRKMLQEEALRHHLTPIVFIGDDLQAHATRYYHREYSLQLTEVCERIGHPLKSRSAVDRAKGQYHLLHAMAEGITDLRSPNKPEPEPPASGDGSTFANDGLSDESLDEHPF